MSSAMAKK